MAKLSLKNSELLKKTKAILNRMPIQGVIVGGIVTAVVAGFSAGNGDSINNEAGNYNGPGYVSTVPNYEFDEEIPMREQINLSPDEIITMPNQEETINVSLEDVNNLNIIINDSDCMDNFINSVCEQLDSDGIKFTYTSDCKDVDVDGAVVITLDQQYMAGPGTAVFAPLRNGRKGNSDALTLATERAFYEKGFLVDGIACGQMGFRQNDDGSVSERVPTPTEEAIAETTEASFVTVSFGTTSNNAELVAKAIEGSLTRYCAYINENQVGDDLIYCVQSDEQLDDLATYYGTDPANIKIQGVDLEEGTVLPGQTVISPNVSDIREFQHNVPTNLYVDKTIWSK